MAQPTSRPLVKRWVSNGSYAPKRVAGVTHSNRQSIIKRCRVGMPVEFVREPSNPHDTNVIAVNVQGQNVGYRILRETTMLDSFSNVLTRQYHTRRYRLSAVVADAIRG